ncbi:cyclin-dependent kinase 3-like [Lethenteron reissneri]|uniref:cyclin-dependent kinase 3-like n=1 Tax=Lethenteron reissneri TaxID=7753 RepID=UPI002AB66CF9|nr:cyclin-dependent kinase 3-like [Lethenteron reissneri]
MELEHPNVVRLLDVLWIFVTRAARVTPWSEVTRQLLCGLRYLHGHGLEHRELTPRSVLVTASGASSSPAGGSDASSWTARVSPSWYRAPELLLRVTCGPGPPTFCWACRAWRSGCSEPPCRTADFAAQTQLGGRHSYGLHAAPRALVDSTPEMGLEVAPGNENVAMALLLELLTFSTRKRISASVALFHPYSLRPQAWPRARPKE